uniref:C-type lectin domain-containing protein n=1 Tax=Denticeps clupeoides TaxID=299321 RepID=A0AAY4DDI8_9TELE
METVGYDQFGASDSQNRRWWEFQRNTGPFNPMLNRLFYFLVRFPHRVACRSRYRLCCTSTLKWVKVAEHTGITFRLYSTGDCHEGWVEFQRHCYYTSKQKANWHLAEQRCIQQEALLFVPNSEEEMNFVSKVVRLRFGYWMGLVEREAEGNWTFVDGTDYNSVPHFWDPGQPDDWDVKVNGEDCGQLHPIFTRRRMGWNDADCTLSFLYVCEHELKAKG